MNYMNTTVAKRLRHRVLVGTPEGKRPLGSYRIIEL
jgi:hypothetical protein